MEGQQHKIPIDLIRINPWYLPPCDSSPLCCRKIFDCMKGKCRKVRNLSTGHAIPDRTESMCRIRHNKNPSQCLLITVRRRGKQVLFLVSDIQNTDMITQHSGDIHRDHRLRLWCDCRLQGIVIHFIRILCQIDQYRHGSDMTDHACRRRICIGGRDHLIPGPDTKQAQCHLHTCCV